MTTQRGLTCTAGAAWNSGSRWYAPDREDVAVTLRGDASDRARVLDAVRMLDTPANHGSPTLFLLSYEACVALDERLPRKARDPLLGPDVLVRRLVPTSAPACARDPVHARVPMRAPPADARARHTASVRRAHEHLLDGVIYQANLAHRIAIDPVAHDEGLAFFLQMIALGAPPCAAFVDIPGWGSVISLSPERFLTRGATGEVRAFPIKGTRPRGATSAEDARLLAQLCASEKDAAEHVMIVDLLRNDLAKLAVPGGVTVERLLEVVSVRNVHHLESTVAALLRDDARMSELLTATVPGGSITGAPKSSAVEVIEELEDGPRGLYTGILGIVDGDRFRSSLLIRTWLRPDEGKGSLHVGGGIVVDSDADAEWQETLDKAAAFASVNQRPLPAPSRFPS